MSAPESSEKIKLHIDPTERGWIRAAILVLVVFAVSVTIAGFMLGIQVPTEEQRVDPRTIADSPPWAVPELAEGVELTQANDTRIEELIPGERYNVYMIARMWTYAPRELTFPVGAEVTFNVTSIDVQHGFKIQNTNVNFMAVPGEVSKLTTVFDEVGTYDFICTEYCGTGHASMFGVVNIVDPADAGSEA